MPKTDSPNDLALKPSIYKIPKHFGPFPLTVHTRLNLQLINANSLGKLDNNMPVSLFASLAHIYMIRRNQLHPMWEFVPYAKHDIKSLGIQCDCCLGRDLRKTEIIQIGLDKQPPSFVAVPECFTLSVADLSESITEEKVLMTRE